MTVANDEQHRRLVAVLGDIIAEAGVPAVLRAVAHIMGCLGSVTGGVVSEAAAIEAWVEEDRG
jgi:uncharacterized membrane protein YqgA involved in biofilm formation